MTMADKPADPAVQDQAVQRSYQAFADLVNWMADNPELRTRLARRQPLRRVLLAVEWAGPDDRLTLHHDLERG
jgi:hypothetical protein